MSANMHGTKAWFLNVRWEFGEGQRYMAKAMCGVLLMDRNRAMDLILMSGMKETIDQLAITNSVRWYGHVMREQKAIGLHIYQLTQLTHTCKGQLTDSRHNHTRCNSLLTFRCQCPTVATKREEVSGSLKHFLSQLPGKMASFVSVSMGM